METIIRRIIREPLKLTGLVTALLGMGGLLGWWSFTKEQSDSILIFIGAVIAFLSLFVTPVTSPVLNDGQYVTLPDGTSATVRKD